MAQACGGHGHGASSEASNAVLDVRGVPPRVRHPRIFEMFDALGPGASFLRPKTFGWRYLEEGPETWRVEITKLGLMS
jgi:uncharacterized protein (DUF2249 family)